MKGKKKCGLGYGTQEHFLACSDIKIVPNGGVGKETLMVIKICGKSFTHLFSWQCRDFLN